MNTNLVTWAKLSVLSWDLLTRERNKVPKRFSECEQPLLTHTGMLWYGTHYISFLPANLASTKQQMKMKTNDVFGLISCVAASSSIKTLCWAWGLRVRQFRAALQEELRNDDSASSLGASKLQTAMFHLSFFPKGLSGNWPYIGNYLQSFKS